jgi:hypothetical protein
LLFTHNTPSFARRKCYPFSDRFVRFLSTRNRYIDWRGLWGDKTLAAIVPKEDVGTYFLRKKINVHPGEAAVFIKKGGVVKIVKESQELVEGVFSRLARFFCDEDLTLMMLDIHERILRFPVGLRSEDVEGAYPDFFKKMEKVYRDRKPTSLLGVQKDDEIYDETSGNVLKEAHNVFKEDIEKLEKESSDLDKKRKQMKEELTELLPDEMKNILGIQGSGQSDSVLLSRDRESIVIDVKMLVSFRPEDAIQIFKLLRGKHLLLQEHLINMMREELIVRVFAPGIAQHSAEELRGNREIFASLQKEAKDELFQWLDLYGIQLNRLSINPALTDVERTALLEREKQAIEKALDLQLERDKREVEREYELLTQREELGKQLLKATKEKDQEIEAIARASLLADKEKDLSLEQIQDKIEEIKQQRAFFAKKTEQGLALSAIEHAWQMDKDKLLTQAQIEKDKIQTQSDAELRKMEVWSREYRENKQLKATLRLQEMEQRRITGGVVQEHVEKMIGIAAQSGALTGDVVAEAIRQASVRKALDEGDAAAQAISHAEAQRYSNKSFREGFMSQTPMGIAGQGPMFIQTGRPIPLGQNTGAPGQRILNSGPGDQESTGALKPCPTCKRLIPEEMKFCGFCGAETDVNG